MRNISGVDKKETENFTKREERKQKQLSRERKNISVRIRTWMLDTINVTEIVADCFAKYLQVDVVYTDFSNAFDKVNYDVLLRLKPFQEYHRVQALVLYYL
ncbi:hypothetical protein ILUMI_24024 [Ignelater luminosus]|uniref:Reverse transcriptase domain-containing protein n=1 Tax=Ignelater luminosus TaxID=2038154 RepID=A0A8K0C7R6_IGNLU|nr:hypothetical protein ILUMI_24024 [Ignelater luminosus]